jgi:hypothetical protein
MFWAKKMQKSIYFESTYGSVAIWESMIRIVKVTGQM